MLISLFAAATGARLDDMKARTQVTEPGLSKDPKPLKPMQFLETITCGNRVPMPKPGPCPMEVAWRRKDGVNWSHIVFSHTLAQCWWICNSTQHHMEHQPQNVPGRRSFAWTSQRTFLVNFLAIAGLFLVTDQRALMLGWLPALILLVCPLLHIVAREGNTINTGRQQEKKILNPCKATGCVGLVITNFFALIAEIFQSLVI